MADKFVLAEALAGLPPERAKAIEDQWHNMEAGFTQASQRAAEFDRAQKEWAGREEQYRQALGSYNTFFEQWNKAQEEAQGTVRNSNMGRFESRRDAPSMDFGEAYDPSAINSALDAKLNAFRDEILGSLNKEKESFGQQVYTNTGQMLQWERQLREIRQSDPEADEKVITEVARQKGLRDLNDAYALAYGRRNLERVATEAATKAAAEARAEAEARTRKELAQTAIEGAGGLTGASSRVVRGGNKPDVPHSRQEAEAMATQALAERLYQTPKA